MWPSRDVLLVTLVLVSLGCGRPPALDPAYAAELEKARATRVASLTREEGWLSLVGLSWLKPGENAFGSDPAGTVVLKAPGIPPRAGFLDLQPDGAVVLRVETGASASAPVAVNGTPSAGATLAVDGAGKPDVVTVGRLRLVVIRRGDQVGARVRDPESPARKGFKGIDYFPVDPRLKVEGAFEKYAAPKEIEVPSAHGPAQKMLAAGLVKFTVDGTPLSLEPFVDEPDDDTFFFVFRDGTAGKESYGGGRFLYADAPKPGTTRVVLDFNRAINPPCAFTPYATCPLPAPGNSLPLRIEAGERAPAGH